MNKNYLSKNLKYLRRKVGLRQYHVYESLDIKRSSWSGYETGRSVPPLDDLITFASYFGVTLDELVLQDIEAHDKAQKIFTKHF